MRERERLDCQTPPPPNSSSWRLRSARSLISRSDDVLAKDRLAVLPPTSYQGSPERALVRSESTGRRQSSGMRFWRRTGAGASETPEDTGAQTAEGQDLGVAHLGRQARLEPDSSAHRHAFRERRYLAHQAVGRERLGQPAPSQRRRRDRDVSYGLPSRAAHSEHTVASSDV
jgi:hypothetical protein